jgi:hypothetical protein
LTTPTPAPDPSRSIDSVSDILRFAHSKGIRLWAESGQLRYKAPQGVLTEHYLDHLRQHRSQILAFLEKASTAERHTAGLVRRAPTTRVPLTFSQLAYWNLFLLKEQRFIRGVASVTNLRGRLRLDEFRESVAANVRRHEALRMRIVLSDAGPEQVVDDQRDYGLQFADLTRVPPVARESEIADQIESFLSQPVDLTVDPLFAARLLKLGSEEHVLILAMEHIISDGLSSRILLRDILSAYAQFVRGTPIALPAVDVQFADYAVWQRGTVQPRIEKHGQYWYERLSDCGRLRFPDDTARQPDTSPDWDRVKVRLGREATAQLHAACRQRKTTLAMSTFAAYAGLVLRWCNAPTTVLKFQSDCRMSPQIENAVGYFAAPLYLRIDMSPETTFSDLVRQVTQEYCTAYEHADFSYLEAQIPRREFTRNGFFNLVPQISRFNPQGARSGRRRTHRDTAAVQTSHPPEHRMGQRAGNVALGIRRGDQRLHLLSEAPFQCRIRQQAETQLSGVHQSDAT